MSAAAGRQLDEVAIDVANEVVAHWHKHHAGSRIKQPFAVYGTQQEILMVL